jgi:ADP-ribose pyrophosphatase YjhB (NUDIX family)
VNNEDGLKTLTRGRLSFSTYNTVVENAVLPTVDFIIQREDGNFLLITRTGGNRWNNVRWFFGGGQRRGETITEALYRLAQDETGLSKADIKSFALSHCQDVFNPASETSLAAHTLMHVFVVQVNQSFIPVLDENSTMPNWNDENLNPNTLVEPVATALQESGLIK